MDGWMDGRTDGRTGGRTFMEMEIEQGLHKRDWQTRVGGGWRVDGERVVCHLRKLRTRVKVRQIGPMFDFGDIGLEFQFIPGLI